MDEIKIRLIVPEDEKKVDKFFGELDEKATDLFNRNNGNYNFLKEFLNGQHPDRIYWGAFAETETGEELAGIVFLWEKDIKVPLLGICIGEKYRGKHLGRPLMNTASDWAQSVGAGGILLTTYLENTPAQRLYEKVGYKQMGTCGGGYLYLLRFPNENIK